MTTASVSSEPLADTPRQHPFRWHETTAVILATVYLLCPWRTLFGDMLTFFLGAFLVFALRLGVDPERTSAHPWRWVAGGLALTAVLAAGMFGFGYAVDSPGLRADWFVMGVLLYLPSAALQEYMLQRYIVPRLARRLLGDRSDALTIVAAAAFFALCHMPLSGLVAPCFFFAIGVNWIYMRSGKLWPVILSHAILGTCYFLVVLGWVPFTGMRTH